MQPSDPPGGKPSGGYSVQAQRKSPTLDAPDDFPSPPWSVRALVEHVLHPMGIPTAQLNVWEPACGRCIMSDVLKEYFRFVYATDKFDYSMQRAGQDRLLNFLDRGDLPPHIHPGRYKAVITNPPFVSGAEFALRAFELNMDLVALLVRTAWVEGVGRHETLFQPFPPTVVAQFAERVPMVKGRWDRNASTATAYAWVVWDRPKRRGRSTEFLWIPPGQRKALTRPDDVERFAL